MVSDPDLPAEQPRPDLRASDADRERVADVLRDALAEGRLQLTEFESRLEETHAARTHGELEQVVHDLPVPAGQSGIAPQSDRIGGMPTSRNGIGILGAFDRKGVWTIARRFTAVGVMGGFDHSHSGTGSPNAPRVVVTGFAFWGGVSVERKVTKAERKRLKAERKERKRLEASE